jgi:hypothetical protein
MKQIEVNVKDEFMGEFLEKLEEFISKNCNSEECMKIEGFTIEEYRKHFIIDSE